MHCSELFIGSSLSQLAKRRPEEPLIFFSNTWISRSEFYKAVMKRSVILNKLLPRKPKVGLDLSHPVEFLSWFFSVCVLGGEVHVLAPEWPISAKLQAIKQSEADLIIDEARNRDLMMTDHLFSTTEIDHVVGDVDPCSIFYVGFTSGSTSSPKGFRRTHRSWIKSFEVESREFRHANNAVIATLSPLSHSLGLYASVRAIQDGSRLVLLSKFDPKGALTAIRNAQATICYAAPSHLKLIEHVKADPIDSVQSVISSGAKWFGPENKLAEIFPQAEFAEFYGTSELSFVSVRRRDDKAPPNSVGRAFRGVEVSIRDHSGAVLPIGEKGLISVESDLLFEGYLSKNAASYRFGDAISVGDIGWLDEKGFLFLEGRENRMIVSAGKNIFSEMLEACLLEHPSIEQALVLGIPHKVRGEVIVCLVIPKTDHSLCIRDLKRYLSQVAPKSLIPKYFAQPFKWKWTRSGKTDVNELKRDLQENRCRYLK